MVYPPRLIDRFLERWRLASPNPAPRPAAKPVALPPKAEPAAGMKAEKIFGAQSPIKTHGLERSPSVYGALGFSREEIQRSVQEGRNEREEYEKQVAAPVQTYRTAGSAFSAQMGGLALLDSEFNRRTAQYENEQRALLASTGRSIDEILPLARGQPLPRIKVGDAL